MSGAMQILRDGALVFLGAGFGGACRWGIGVGAQAALGATRFPLATFLANLLACALIGIFAGASVRLGAGVPARLFVVTGFLGGMSTMSAFGLETVVLLRRGALFVAGANVCLTLGVCLGALWLLMKKAEAFS